MKLFAIGDLHLSYGVDKPMSLFGPNWEAHDQKIKKAWEEIVSAEDVVLIPGDLSWGMRFSEAEKDLKWLEALPGYKICIRGNHDYWWDRPGKLNKCYRTLYFLQNKGYLLGEKAICGTRGWLSPGTDYFTAEDQKLYLRELERLKLSLEDGLKKGAKEIWVMLHYPPAAVGMTNSPLIELLKAYPVTRVIYGHLHDEASWQSALQGEYDGIVYQLVSADYLNFKLVELKENKGINGE